MRLKKAERNAADQGRVLLIAYHFGDRQATGSFRWNAMTRHLVDLGWSFDVVTTERRGGRPKSPPSSEPDDRICIHFLPVPTWPQTLTNGTLEFAGRLARSLRAARRARGKGRSATERLGAAPGAPAQHRISRLLDSAGWALTELIWSERAVRWARRRAREHTYDAVVVSSPPHSTQLAGMRLARALNVPYLADYRDPWYFGIRRPAVPLDPAQRALGRIFEGVTMKRAAVVIGNTDRAARALRELYADSFPVVAVPNGYDALEDVNPPDPGCFRVVYAGHLYPWHDARGLLQACGALRRTRDLGGERFRVEFMGIDRRLAGGSVQALAESYGLSACVRFHAPASREEALRLQQSAAVTVVFDHFHGLSVPMKFYDCAQMYGSLLLLGAPDGALAEAAARIGCQVHRPSDPAGIVAELEEAYRRWQDGALDERADRSGIFDRRVQSRRVHDLLSRVTAARDVDQAMASVAGNGSVAVRR